MSRVLRICLRILLILAILLLVSGAGGYLYLRRSLPQTAGSITVVGLRAPVDIVRDTNAIPHIYAQNKVDALFGLGYVHAQDRLWQLEFQRRTGQGRLSEVLGEPTVGTDRFLRTLGVHRAAQAAWDALPAESREPIDAYVSGINAFIADHRGSQLPPEFTILRTRPEPWTGADVITWGKMMAFDLGSNYNAELLRSDMIRAVGADRAQQLLQGTLNDPLSITQAAPTSSYADLAAATEQVRVLMGFGDNNGEVIGSNNWVVDGTKSTTGKPLLANDPHLASRLPSIWYLAHLSAGDFNVIGGTIPGLPAIIIGRNTSIAWGMTNMDPDVQDLFRERLDATGTRVEYQGQMEPLTIITETIEVQGQEPVQVRVRISRHGPLISDAVNTNEESRPPEQRAAPLEPLALRWTALDPEDRTIDAFLGVNQAQDWNAFKAALQHYVVPAQNFVYADVAGNIGYYAPGRIPIRTGNGGDVPAEGWTGAHEWNGWVAFEQLPQAYNPPSHFIVTANNRPVPADYPYMLGREWAPAFRADRITQLLQAKAQLSPDDMVAIQADTVSLQAQELLPKLLALTTPETEQEQRAFDLLKQWDGNMSRDSIPATIYASWFYRLPRTLAGDELGEELIIRYQTRNTFISPFLPATFDDRTNVWCDNVATAPREDCAQVAQQTFREAVQSLTERLGAQMDSWQWERVHFVGFSHQPFTGIPVLGSIFDRSIPNGGDGNSVNPGGYSFSRPFRQSFIPGYRQVIDLASPDGGRFIQAIGQSGHVLSPHYADYMADWQAVHAYPMRFERAALEQEQHETLHLQP